MFCAFALAIDEALIFKDLLQLMCCSRANPSRVDFALLQNDAHILLTLLQMEARILDPPALQYATPFKTPNTGEWNLRGTRFNTGATLRSYAIASFAPPNRVGRQGDPGSVMVCCHKPCTVPSPIPGCSLVHVLTHIHVQFSTAAVSCLLLT